MKLNSNNLASLARLAMAVGGTVAVVSPEAAGHIQAVGAGLIGIAGLWGQINAIIHPSVAHQVKQAINQGIIQ